MYHSFCAIFTWEHFQALKSSCVSICWAANCNVGTASLKKGKMLSNQSYGNRCEGYTILGLSTTSSPMEMDKLEMKL